MSFSIGDEVIVARTSFYTPKNKPTIIKEKCNTIHPDRGQCWITVSGAISAHHYSDELEHVYPNGDRSEEL